MYFFSHSFLLPKRRWLVPCHLLFYAYSYRLDRYDLTSPYGIQKHYRTTGSLLDLDEGRTR